MKTTAMVIGTASSLLLAISAESYAQPCLFTGDYAMESWSHSGTLGGRVIIPASGPSESATFVYSDHVAPGATRIAIFAMRAVATGTIQFDWEHSIGTSGTAVVDLAAFVEGPGGAPTLTPLATGSGNGSATISVQEGKTFGWLVSAHGFLFTSPVSGTVVISNLTDPDEPDCDNDGVGDACELIAGTSMDCNGNEIPDKCDLCSSGFEWSALDGVLQGGDAFALTTFNDGSGPGLYAGGKFTHVDGVPVGRVAKWDGASWSPVGSGMDNWVFALTVYNSALYAGGYFTTAGGEPASRIAKWNNGSWYPLGSGMDEGVLCLEGVSSRLYAGGYFTMAGGVTAERIARWNGNTWSQPLQGIPGSYYVVRAMTTFDDGNGPALYVGGHFSRVAGGNIYAQNIAKYDFDLAYWFGVGGGVARPDGLSAIVLALAVYDDGSGPALYAGGLFDSAGGVSAKNIAKWNGSTWSALGSGADGIVRSLTTFDDGSGLALYAGGDFKNAGGESANRIAKWDGTSWSPLGRGINDGWTGGTVQALASLADGSGPAALYAAGDISRAGDVTAYRIAKWSCTRYDDCNGNGRLDECELGEYHLELDGQDDFVDLGGSEVLDTLALGDFTLEMWINTSDAGRSILIGNYDGNPSWNFEIHNGAPAGHLRLYLSGEDHHDDAVVVDGAWHHVAATRDASGGLVKMYIDGQEIYSAASATPGYGVGHNTMIGRDPRPSSHYFLGAMDEVRVWNRTRTQPQIESAMGARLTGSEPGLVGYWRFDTGGGLTAYDEARGNHGTLVNGTTWVVEDPKANDCNANSWLDECDRSGDANGDDLLTLSDFAFLSDCFSGPCPPAGCQPAQYDEPCCRLADMDVDGDVDLQDCASFAVLFDHE